MSATIAIFFKLPVTGFPFQSPKDHIIAKKKKKIILPSPRNGLIE